jgi:hypothetical protein
MNSARYLRLSVAVMMTLVQAANTASARAQSIAASGASWTSLFDGKTTDGWRGFKKPGFPTQGWVVEDGCLKHLKRGGGGDIITVKKYADFELEWEWRVGRGANSGIKYFIIEERGEAIGHEYQILDDTEQLAAKRINKGSTASFYDVFPPKNPALRPSGQFNHARILVQGKRVEHWLNGVKVLEYELESEALKAAIAASKFRSVPGFGTKLAGHILLQDHGGEVWFRNIRLRELACPGSGK